MGIFFNQVQPASEARIFELLKNGEWKYPERLQLKLPDMERYIIYADYGDCVILLQSARNTNETYHTSIQGAGYVMYDEERFMELLEKF